MKRILPSESDARFSGHLRHYHRQRTKTPRTWDDWVEGVDAKAGRKKNWPRIMGITVAVLALVGIIAGLVIELS
jgi:hypothetical protein